MSRARRLRRERERASKVEAGRLVTLFEGFAERGYLKFDTANYAVVMLDNFWELYEGEKQKNLCKNMLFYCNIMNAYEGKEVDMQAALLISMKDRDGNVEKKYYYKSGTLAPIGSNNSKIEFKGVDLKQENK